jgi:hypothetical protein
VAVIFGWQVVGLPMKQTSKRAKNSKSRHATKKEVVMKSGKSVV